MAIGRNPLAGDVDAREKDQAAPLSVSQAVGAAKRTVNAMGTFMVVGEVSGFRGPNARSGHCYFQVKDDESSMDVIVWRGTYAKLETKFRDGMSVVLTGSFDVYAGSGRLSFIARNVELLGEGLLRQQVDALARKLAAEGLMADERKRRIPKFCMRIAVVTSLSGSVIDDVKRTLRRRNPLVEIDVAGCSVQGPNAPAEIMRALQVAAAARPEAILLVRGGGSYEDLMTFNDEALARAVAACPVPVITGIGHEPDTTICDMVSDRRTSTPTAAAESVAPSIGDVVALIEQRRQRLGAAMGAMTNAQRMQVEALGNRSDQAMGNDLDRRRVVLEGFARRRCLEDPMAFFVQDRIQRLEQDGQRLHDSVPRLLARDQRLVAASGERLGVAGKALVQPFEAQVGRSAAALDALSPLRVLARGYAITRDDEGHVVTDAGRLSVGSNVRVDLSKGSFEATVVETSDRARS